MIEVSMNLQANSKRNLATTLWISAPGITIWWWRLTGRTRV